MDSGWSWVTMLAAFGVHASCRGLQHTSGFIRSILLQNVYPNEQSLVTWITSIYSGVLNFLGPIASVLVYKYGCRTSVIVGGLLETFGLVLSFFAPNKWLYLITYSFLSAASSGLTYSTVPILLGFNFERHLSFASRFAIAGQAVGLIAMPEIINFFFYKYGEKGTFLLLGGVTIQKLVLGALMRPSSLELDQLSKYRKPETANYEQCQSELTEQISSEKPYILKVLLSGEDNMAYESDETETDTTASETQYTKQTAVLPTEDNLACEPGTENIQVEIQDAEKTMNIEEHILNNAASFTAGEINTNSCSSSTQQLPTKPSTTKNKMSDMDDSAHVFSNDNQTEEINMDTEINLRSKIAESYGEDNLAYECDEDNLAYECDKMENAKHDTRDAEKMANIDKEGGRGGPNFISDENDKINCSKNEQKFSPETSSIKKMSDLDGSAGEISRENKTETKLDTESNVREKIAGSSGEENLAYESDEKGIPEPSTAEIKMADLNNSADEISNENRTEEKKMDTEINEGGKIAASFGEDNMEYETDEKDNSKSEKQDAEKTPNIEEQAQNNKSGFTADDQNTNSCTDSTIQIIPKPSTAEIKDAGKTRNNEKQIQNNGSGFTADDQITNSCIDSASNITSKPSTTKNKMSDLNDSTDEISHENQTEENKLDAEINTRGKIDGSSGEDTLAYEPDETENTKSETEYADKTLNFEEKTQNNDLNSTEDYKQTNNSTYSVQHIHPKTSKKKNKMSDLDDSADEISHESQTEENKLKTEINVRSKIAASSGEDNLAYGCDEMENIESERRNAEKPLNTGEEAQSNVPSSTGDEKHTNNCFYSVQQFHPKSSTAKNKMSDVNNSADGISHENQTEENKTGLKIDVRGSIAQGLNKVKNNGTFTVLKIRKFRFFLLGILSYSIGERTVYMMSPNYFIENGSNHNEVNSLLSILGVSAVISQFLMIILANSKLVDTYVLFAVPFGILGVITMLLPFYVQTFSGRVKYVIFFGLYNCPVQCLLDQLILRIAGPDTFTTAVDVVDFTRGLAGMFGPPLSGCMYMMCLVTLVFLPDESDK